jgi:glycine cleavage system H lipoate-binding protein
MVAILVVLTIVLFVSADLLVEWLRVRRAVPATATKASEAGADLILPTLQADRFVLPGGLFFHRGHTWVNLLFSGQVKIGVDDFLQRVLGHVDGIALPAVGVQVSEGQPFALIRQGGRTMTLPAPVDGVVCAVNEELSKLPSLVKRDPYTRGWLVAIRPADLSANLPKLLVGEGAFGWLRAELDRMTQFLRGVLMQRSDALLGATAADGGIMIDGVLEHLGDDTWSDFQSKFLAG